jgi:5'-3' exonuclease, N-terminal resolvase-like domain
MTRHVRIIDGMNYFRNHIEKYGRSVSQLYLDCNMPTHTHSTTIWVWEGKNSTKLRRTLWQKYKMNRVRTANWDALFDSVKFFQELLQNTGDFQVAVENYEADDVIAFLAERYCPYTSVSILSNDRDFRQLGVLPNVRLEAAPFPEARDSDVRLYKTLCGDQSDNIPGIPGFGPKAFEALSDQNRNYLNTIFSSQAFNQLSISQELTGLKDKHFSYLKENKGTLYTFWKIVGFLPLSDSEVMINLTRGNPANYQHGLAKLQRFMV